MFEERSCYSQRKIYVCYNRLSHINGKLQLSYLLATYCIGSCQSIFHNSRPHFLFHITRRRARLVANSIRSSIGCLYFTCLFRHLIFFLLLIAIIYHFSLSIAFPFNFSSSIFVNLGIICAPLTLLHLQLELFLLLESSRNVGDQISVAWLRLSW